MKVLITMKRRRNIHNQTIERITKYIFKSPFIIDEQIGLHQTHKLD